MKICSICGSNKYVKNYKGKTLLCCKHISQMRRCGKILERTQRDKNEIVDCESHYEVILYDIKSNEVGRAKIDKDYVHLLDSKKWFFSLGYAKTNRGKKQIFLHRIIIGAKEGEIVDHINRDPLDNRRKNLRIVSQRINIINSRKGKNNTSGFVGVSWYRNYEKWEAFIHLGGKKLIIGRYKDKKDAIKMRKKYEDKYYSKYLILS